ncbi:MAG: hypothetical protein A2341_27215 [Deltaproteobacteria bacterium RIFOXYB12_FULL_58_9]|nr:MAG: hypothetical protein A2341_27215 [Deltaproteobacteria bacterium RIFOXYB12_FULL_58_9]
MNQTFKENLASSSRVAWVAWLAVAGCSRGGFEWYPDGEEQQSRCTPFWSNPTLSAPEPLTAVNTPSREWKTFVLSDGLTLWFASNRAGGPGANDVYVATRSDLNEPFGNVTLAPGINTQYDEWGVVFSSDGMTAYTSSNRPGGPGDADLWVAHLERSYDLESSVFQPVENVNTTEPEYDPFIASDNLTLYFNRSNQLYWAVRETPHGPFTSVEPIPGIDFESAGNVSTTNDERVMVFNGAEQRPGSQVWYATRGSTEDLFGKPEVVTIREMESVTQQDPFIAPDGCTLYLSIVIEDALTDVYVVRLEAVVDFNEGLKVSNKLE